MTLFKNKYRIESNRLQGYDYTKDGAYFITICVRYHQHRFGTIKNGKLIPTPEGEIAQQCWLEMFEHFENAKMDEFIIMPNHMHGIIFIDDPEQIAAKHRRSQQQAREHEECFLLPPHGGITGDSNAMLTKHCIGKMVRWYKAKCTFKIRNELEKPFEWLGNYYDHIVRNQQDFERIQHYIISNPTKWEADKFYTT
ncbi:MAG: hypothetical protein V4590_10220 [Bacteroidota bacterium]